MKPEEAIELLGNLKVCKQAHTLFNIEKEAVDMAIEALREQRQHCEWIIRRNRQGEHIYSVCSKCNMAYLDTDFPNFCPNCGADMRRKEGEAE